MTDLLPSWRAGANRDSLLSFIEASGDVPVEERVACFDNDGTLWCERPTYVQFDFFVDALAHRQAAEPELAEVPEYAALLSGDKEAIGKLGLERIGGALVGLFEGISPEAFTAATKEFMARGTHPTLGRLRSDLVYRPMLELVAELQRHDFTVCVVTGGGTEFVRAISQSQYGVPPERVVGTLVQYDYLRGVDGLPALQRTSRIVGTANEGAAKVGNIQSQLGRRPIFAAGNSGGDREMLEWAAASGGPTLAVLVDHDDAEREFAYVSTAETFAEPEPITAVGERLGWTVVSMSNDWETVF